MKIKNKKITIFGKFVFPIFIMLFSLVLAACSDSDAPITPNYPPNIFAKVSGTYNLDYKGQGKLFLLEDPHGIMITSFYKDSTGKQFYLGLNLYFTEGELTTGTFPIVEKQDTAAIYAVTFFETGKDDDKQTFISYSGEITVTEIADDKLKATFHFLAKDKNNNSVMIENGSLYITE